jgi:transcription elongation factor GreB
MGWLHLGLAGRLPGTALLVGPVSKAFTKDDDTAGEPGGQPIVARRRHPLLPGTPNYVTRCGLLSLQQELAELDGQGQEKGQGQEDAQLNAGADVDAGLHAGAASVTGGDRGAQQERQAAAAWRRQLEERIATAVLAPPPADREEIRFGARVRISDANGVRSVQIVGVDEADPKDGLIAFVAPVARALLGRRAGEVVSVRTPGGEDELEILSVVYDPV